MHGLAAFAWDAGDEAGRRLAAVQLVRLRAASQGQVAAAFGVDPPPSGGGTRRWPAAGWPGWSLSAAGPKGASKLTPALAARIAGLDAATGVSTFNRPGRAGPGPAGRPGTGRGR